MNSAIMRRGFGVAVRVHAERFGRSRLTSAVTLATADRLLTDPRGGVAAMTRLGRTGWWGTLLGITYVPALFLAVVAALAQRWVFGVTGLLAALAASVAFAGRYHRQRHSRRLTDTRDHPWLLTDTASKPGRRIGDALVTDAIAIADSTRSRLVLEVRPDNVAAVALYARHGFVEARRAGTDTIVMERRT